MVAEEIRTLSDSTKDLLTQNDQKKRMFFPELADEIKHLRNLFRPGQKSAVDGIKMCVIFSPGIDIVR